MRRLLHTLCRTLLATFAPGRWKGLNEMRYWQGRVRAEGQLGNAHYAEFYTDQFGLSPAFYQGKRLLDIGCGPRGSLEWADMAAERVGLDPLAERYRALGTGRHAMRYVAAPSESIPFEDGHFDVVCSFNSLDHVDDLARTVAEIRRVLRPGGLFLLLTDVNHLATDCEPQSFSWDVTARFLPDLVVVQEEHYEKLDGGMYDSLRAAIAYDHTDPTQRYGILAAMLRRQRSGRPG